MGLNALSLLRRAASSVALVAAATACQADTATPVFPSAPPSPSSPSDAAAGGAERAPVWPSAAPTSQPGIAHASPGLRISGAYTLRIEADLDGTCGWPVTAFVWPVFVEVASRAIGGNTSGWIAFPPVSSGSPNRWSISVEPAATEVTPAEGTPGPAAAAYDVTVAGGRWVGVAPSRAHDGRGEITSGTASGARLTLVLPGSEKRWECRSEATWSLLTRYIDRD